MRLPITKVRSEGLEKQQPFCGQLEPMAAVGRAGSWQTCYWAWLEVQGPVCSAQQKLFLTVSRSCQSHPISSLNFSMRQTESVRFLDFRANGSLNGGSGDRRERLGVAGDVLALPQDLTADLPKLLANFD